jgi:hypothetical protein
MTRFNFLLCSERSGSNLIRVIVDAHPEICAPGPILLGNYVLRHRYVFGDLEDDANWNALVGAVGRASRRGQGMWGVELSDAEILDGVSERSFGAIYRFVYETTLRRQGKNLLFIKENRAFRYMWLIAEQFPDARFVFQVRDPRDYYLSCKKGWPWRTKYGSPLRTIETWQEDQTEYLNIRQSVGPSRIFFQRYEDLLDDPARVLKPMCEFLGVAYDPRMLDYHRKDASHAMADTSRAWKNLSRPILHGNAAKYLTGLSGPELRMIEARLGELMRRLGYTPRYDDAAAAGPPSLGNALTEFWLESKASARGIGSALSQLRKGRKRDAKPGAPPGELASRVLKPHY